MQRWPDKLWLVRHGQSAGNVARDAAYAAGLAEIEITTRDMDVPLSKLGERQSLALGHWFSGMSASDRPDILLSSPYLRAIRTAEIIRSAGGLLPGSANTHIDERLREKEFGILDRLTGLGIENKHPDQAALRRVLGKFYYRPPGGESWCDVILRLRSLIDTISLHYGKRRVLIVGHQVTVLCMRYLLEYLDEPRVLAIDAEGDVANCGVTEYQFGAEEGGTGSLVLARYNFVAPLVEEGAQVTSAPDAKVSAG
jgi:broad specificity phosphatase PhoE